MSNPRFGDFASFGQPYIIVFYFQALFAMTIPSSRYFFWGMVQLPISMFSSQELKQP